MELLPSIFLTNTLFRMISQDSPSKGLHSLTLAGNELSKFYCIILLIYLNSESSSLQVKIHHFNTPQVEAGKQETACWGASELTGKPPSGYPSHVCGLQFCKLLLLCVTKARRKRLHTWVRKRSLLFSCVPLGCPIDKGNHCASWQKRNTYRAPFQYFKA